MSRPKPFKVTHGPTSLEVPLKISQFHLAERLKPLADKVTFTPRVFLSPLFGHLNNLSPYKLKERLQ